MDCGIFSTRHAAVHREGSYLDIDAGHRPAKDDAVERDLRVELIIRMLEMWEVAEELGNIACRGAVSGEKEGYVEY